MAVTAHHTVLRGFRVGFWLTGEGSADTANVVAEQGAGLDLGTVAVEGDFQLAVADLHLHLSFLGGVGADEWLLGIIIAAVDEDVLVGWEFFFVVDVHARGVGCDVLVGWRQLDDDIVALFLSQDDQDLLALLLLVAWLACVFALVFDIADHDGNLFIRVLVLVVVVWS